MITAKQLYEKSIEQQITHRRRFEDISEDERLKFEAFAYWASELKTETSANISVFKLQDVIEYFAKDLQPKPDYFEWYLDVAKGVVVFKTNKETL